MEQNKTNRDLKALEDIRNLDVDYSKFEEKAGTANAVQFQIDKENYKVFPVEDENAVYKISEKDTRGEICLENSPNLADYSGPFRPGLRFSDFSEEALLNLLWADHEYYEILMNLWAAEISRRKGEAVMKEIEAAAWKMILLPKIPEIVKEWEGFPVEVLPQPGKEILIFNPFRPDDRYASCGKARLINMNLGCHEFVLNAIEAWSTQVIMRYGLDEMFSIQWNLWSDQALDKVREIKIKWLHVDEGDTTPVEAFMKDIQIDVTSFPGKAFEMTFEMPDRNTGYVGFNKCCSVNQWEALGRPDILKKNCHSVCPASMIETAKMYSPDMKVDILAIPPRRSKEDVCCRYRLRME